MLWIYVLNLVINHPPKKAFKTATLMKNDYSQVHPQLRTISRMIPPLSFSKKNHGLVNFFMCLIPGIRPIDGIDIENIFIPRMDGEGKLRLRIYRPETNNASGSLLLWLHGGGYIIGKPEMDDWNCAEYTRVLGITVVSVDYRLAPQYPFPAALQDSQSALKWVVANSEKYKVYPNRIAIGGKSAGAGLAAALAQLTHDQQDIKLACQLLVYPRLDDRTSLKTDLDDSNNLTWDLKSNRYGWESYLGKLHAAEDVPAYAVPARRMDLSGLPATWIGVGSLDIFHDEDVSYARKLVEGGVECKLEVVPGAFHGFDVINRKLPVVQDFRKSQMAALKKYLFS